MCIHNPTYEHMNHLVQVKLFLGALYDALLDSVARDQSIHMHLLLLADAVHTRHRLQVHLCRDNDEMEGENK